MACLQGVFAYRPVVLQTALPDVEIPTTWVNRFMFDHQFPFDPTHGYDLNRLLQVRAPMEPPGYVEFWRSMHEETFRLPLDLQTRPSPQKVQGYDVLEAYYTSLDGFRVGAWVLMPKGITPRHAVVFGHGYGPQTGPALPNPHMPTSAWIFPSGRGFGLSARQDLPGNAMEHVLFGIRDKRSYLHLGCVADIWRSREAILALAAEAAGRVNLIAGSFGGGIGAMALGFEHRFARAYLRVPSFGNHPLRLTMQCTGSGESVRRFHAANPGVVEPVLAYFDSAVAARHVKTPTLVSAALFDPSVPPAGQFAVANELTARGGKLVVVPAGHFDYPGLAEESEKLEREIGDWFQQDG
jgi:cephalosporin-C deacetylase